MVDLEQRGILRNNRGVALLLAVTVISLLVAVTVQFSKDMRQELMSSANLLVSSRMAIMAKSGYNLAVALLEEDDGENQYDSFHDIWAQLENQDFSNLYGRGKLDIAIADLSGRLQLNSLVSTSGQGGGNAAANKNREILQELLLGVGQDEMSDEDAEMIVNAIVDWIDADDQESGIVETESSYYRSLEPSYTCRNGPMEFIEELLLIRGITSDLYYGNDAFPGLRHLVTVYGNDGKININTASADILQALSKDMTTEFVQELLDFRLQSENKDQLQNPQWYKNLPWGQVIDLGNSVGTSSRFFTVKVTAEQDQMRKTLTTVVERQKGSIPTIVSRKIE
ncbi:MAG: type II secretion system minor pseudopilin GspK [Desulfopila sp.]|nr:type II secretion system minor pseudopilin GspK [Desulfopila sp.]